MAITIAFPERDGSSSQEIASAVESAQAAAERAEAAADATGINLCPFISGRPEAAELVLRLEVVTSLDLDVTRCAASAETASTGTAVFSITMDNAAVGTVTFTASADGVVALSDTTVGPGVLKIIAPASQDATLSDVSITLTGDR